MTTLPHVTMAHPTMQQDRQDRLEELYRADGRHDSAHPMHGLYTGLKVLEDVYQTQVAEQAEWEAGQKAEAEAAYSSAQGGEW